MILLGFLLSGWAGAIVGVAALAVVQAARRRDDRRCCGHFRWDPASWRFVPVPDEDCP